MRLSFYAGFIDKDTGVGVKPCKGKTDVVVDQTDLGGGDSGILELHGGTLFAAENDDGFALHTDSAGTWVWGIRISCRQLGRFLSRYLKDGN